MAAPNAFTRRETDLNASSFAGIGKSTSFGLELVSTKAKTGIPNFCASAMAMCSLLMSTTNSAAGRRLLTRQRNQRLEVAAWQK